MKLFEHDNKAFYYATNVSKQGIEYISYLSFIKSKNSEQAIRYVIDTTCTDNRTNCSLKKAELEEKFLC
ncbi:hypothetical protein [Cytobacillus purgationiresistens]|nr:hypothetical protein [Cytobacillus purgationiresistens]